MKFLVWKNIVGVIASNQVLLFLCVVGDGGGGGSSGPNQFLDFIFFEKFGKYRVPSRGNGGC